MSINGKILTFVACLCVLSIFASAAVSVSAESDIISNSESADITETDVETISGIDSDESKVSVDYGDYMAENDSIGEYRGEPVVLSAAEALTGNAEAFEGRTAVLISRGESITWILPEIEEAMYSVRVDYASMLDGRNSYSCEILINGKSVYRQASYVALHKLWANSESVEKLPERYFELDQFGNELVSLLEEMQGWQQRTLQDSDGRYEGGLLFRLKTGDSLTLKIGKSSIAISEIALTAAEELPSYDEIKEQYVQKGYSVLSGEATVIQAELPLYTSDSSLLPTSDHMSSATQPQDAMHIVQNTIGQEYWQYAEQTITWKFTVPETGLYSINVRYRQNYQRGVSVGRIIRIDGEIPFEEMKRYLFEYSNSWENEQLGNGSEPYLFYLEAGKEHILSMEVVMAYPDEIIQMEKVLQELNIFYRQALMIVGTNPDPYRDYMLKSVMPDFDKDLVEFDRDLRELLDMLYESGFKKGGNVVVVEELADMITSFSEKPSKIPVRLSAFNDSLSALGTWLSELSRQPLEIDYVSFIPSEEPAPRDDTGFFTEFGYSLKVFFASFYGDYSSITTSNNEQALTIWINSGRDQAQVIKRLVSGSFTAEYGIAVNINLVLQGLIPATLSGKGPDVIIGVNPTDAINLAARDALVDLREFTDVEGAASFETVRTWFQADSFTPYSYEDEIYALPVEENFNMMFVRTDIFEELELAVPETWEELNNTISVLLRNNLDVGLPTNLGQNSVNESVFQMLLFQNGGSYYEDGWSSTGFGTPAAVTAFTQWTEYFTKYTLPIDYDLFSRFRSGQMPLAINAYSFYNNLNVAAPEIRGLWKMMPVPGTVREDGTIDHTTSGSGSAIAMFRKADQEAGWKFLQWYVSAETQGMYAKQIESVLGPGGRCTPATVEALRDIGWDEDIEEEIMEQWSQMLQVPMTPVSYYLSRSISNAFRKVTYSYTDPRETLNRYNREINKEIVRKRNNLGM